MTEPPPSNASGGATWREGPGLIARGTAMGMADVVPGVSGGTMALILGIYTRLVAAIRSFDARFLGRLLKLDLRAALSDVAWKFLGFVVLGQALGLVVCTKVIPLPTLLHEHPEPVYGAFFGLIVGSIALLGRDVWRAGVTPGRALAVLAGLGVGLLVVTATRTSDPQHSPWIVFLCGAVAICAMILPGISGSFILLVLGQYTYVFGAVGEVIHPASGDNADRIHALLHVVGPFGAGCLIGIVSFSRLLHALLRRFEQGTIAFMTGLLAGSLVAVWPFALREYAEVRGKTKLVSTQLAWPDTLTPERWGVLALILGGAVAVLLLDWLARPKHTPDA